MLPQGAWWELVTIMVTSSLGAALVIGAYYIGVMVRY